MRKNRKILDIESQQITYPPGSVVSAELCRVTHTPVHIHASSVELIYCLEGEVSVRCNHEIVTLRKGQIFTADFEDIHCLFSNKDNLLIIMHIDLKNLEKPWDFLRYVYFACEDSTCQPYQQAPLQQIKNLVLAITFLQTKQSTLSAGKISAAANKIVNILLEYFDWFNYINVYPNSNDEIRDRFQSISAYCQNNFRRKVTISELAKTVHINENYLSQFIRKSPYGSFSNMIGYIRCFAAQYLLLTTDFSVIEISSQCGFSDDKYFYKHFKLAWGQTPKELKQWYKDYIKTENEIHIISDRDAHQILEPYAAEYFAHYVLNQ